MAKVPRMLGPYEILAPLGAGGMAETYLAVKRGPGGFEQRVCLKRIRHDFGNEADLTRQFLGEASIAATLRHAAIAQVLDFGHDEGDYYLALELVDGLDLRLLVQRLDAPVDPGLVLYLAVELATALDVAHRAQGGIVHRDVSPSNVLVSIEGEVKLTDFGIARSAEGPRHTRTGIVKGKVPYMAPEYARTARFDARCDLFGLGVLLYECLTGGTRPYDGATDLETLERATRGEHVPLASLAPRAPTALVEAVERLIEPEPELRFQTAGELLDTLLLVEPRLDARRELGALVRRLRPPPRPDPTAPATGAEASARAAPEEAAFAATEPAPMAAPAAPTRTQPTPRPHHSAASLPSLLPWLALGISLLALASLAVVSLRTPAPTPADTASPAPTMAAPTPAPPPPEAEALAPAGNAAEAPAASPSKQRGKAPRAVQSPSPRPARGGGKASLEVVVLPYGEVFVDGKPRGASPARLKLSPGAHVVEGRGPSVSGRRELTLRAGEGEHVVFR